MRIVRDRLIFLGLVALDEAASACRTEPIEPSVPLRVVVAMLHALAGGDRAIFDEFLATLRMTGGDRAMHDTIRHTSAHTVVQGVARRLGCEMDIKLSSDISDAQSPVDPGSDQWSQIHLPRLNDAERERQRFARAFYSASRRKMAGKRRLSCG